MAKIITHHHVLAVPDAQRTAEFFVQQLGFELRPVEDAGWRFVVRDGFMVMLGSCPDAIPPGKLGDHSYFAYFAVDDVDAYFEEVRAKGAQVVRPPGALVYTSSSSWRIPTNAWLWGTSTHAKAGSTAPSRVAGRRGGNVKTRR